MCDAVLIESYALKVREMQLYSAAGAFGVKLVYERGLQSNAEED